MNQINFLPPSFYHRRHRRRRVVIEALLVVAIAASFGGWLLLGDASLEKLRDDVARIEAEGVNARAQLQELAALRAEHRVLAGQLSVHRQVTLPVGFTQVLAAIAQLTPPSIAYTDMRLACGRPSPAPKPATDAGRSRGAVKLRAAAAPAPAEAIRIELTGLSPDDRRIADLVGRLADHPLFSQVKLEFSRTTEQHDLVARRFRLSLAVPLDRDYRPADGEEVADAH